MGYSFADASTRETAPDHGIVLVAGVRRVLKHSGFRSRGFDFTTHLSPAKIVLVQKAALRLWHR